MLFLFKFKKKSCIFQVTIFFLLNSRFFFTNKNIPHPPTEKGQTTIYKTVHRKLKKDKQYNVQIKENRTNYDLQNTTQKIKERQTKQIKENRTNNDLQNTTQKIKERQTIQRRKIKEQKDKQ